MFGLDPFIFGIIAALPMGMTSLAILRAWRSSRRNRMDRCGNCGGSLYAPGALAGPSLIEGHLVCEPCAAKERRRLGRNLIAAAGITVLTALTLAAVTVWAPSELGSHPWIPAVATALVYPAIFGGAIAWMKRANRRAAQRLGLQRHLTFGASSDSTLAPAAGRIGASRGTSDDA